MWVLSIAWECPRKTYGGLGTVVSRLTPALSEVGHKVIHLCTGDGGGCYNYEGVMCCDLRRVQAPGGLLDRGEALALSSQCLDLVPGFDIVMAHDFHSTGCVFLSKEYSIRTYFFLHSLGDPMMVIPAAESSDVVVVNSRRLRDAVTSIARPNDIRVVYYPPPYPLTERTTNFRRTTRILILTRYQQNKDPGWVLDILNEIWGRRGGFTVTLAGRGVELYRYTYPFLNVIGEVSEERKRELIRTHDLLIYPSVEEPYGMVPLESIALGTPALISTGAGVSEVIKDGHIDPHNREGVRESLTQYIGNPDAINELLSKQRGYDIMRKTWVDVARELGVV
ncbi:MAG: glycosyltransferase family 4 protein [Thermosphaera sp.]